MAGFDKYTCKYYYSHNCRGWVLNYGGVCSECSAKGREKDGDSQVILGTSLMTPWFS
ncbi:uncharacterized protein BCR38DRAFT_485269 [Pseudomassariella vexata]|uniref:Uncharacterized protein n=1 Tax=Pseudomassariella vexata TaxID=1141098 RepID=A0A1Y2DXV8_9PEZI|nr:uncharacterized protein BCR38DRAFT_485269 [Pseudomassariella vexata]ORY64132.1 hypothetical protein BCR38DRAFT_485269 [Pseudomassariella vexata]